MATSLDFGMPAGISGVLQPKLAHKWQVVFKGFGNGVETQHLTSQVITCSRPNINWEEVTMHRYNGQAYAMSKYAFDAARMTVEDDLNSLASNAIQQQLTRQQHLIGSGAPFLATAASGSEYKFGMVLQQLNGNDTIIEEWAYEGCWIKGSDYGEGDYSSTEAMKITLEIRFDMVRQSIKQTGSTGVATGGVA